MLGAWEGTERTLTQGPYTFCSTQQVFPTVRTCPLFRFTTHRSVHKNLTLWGLASFGGCGDHPLGDSILASWALGCEPRAGASSLNASPGLRQEPQKPAGGHSPQPALQTQGSLGWPSEPQCQDPTPGRWGGGRRRRLALLREDSGCRTLLRCTMSWAPVLLGLLLHGTGEKPRSWRPPAPPRALLCPGAHTPLCPQAAALSPC